MPLDFQSIIVAHVLDEYLRWGGAIRAGDRHARGPYGLAAELREYGVPFHPAAFSGVKTLPPARRMAFSRAARRLADLGLAGLVKWRGSKKVANVRLTPTGLTIAIRLARQLGEQPDLDALTLALDNAKWATPDHRAAVEAMWEVSP